MLQSLEKGGSHTEYNIAKKRAKKAVYAAKQEAEKSRFKDIDPSSDDVYRIAKQMKRDNQDVVGDMCVRNDAGELALDNDAKKKAWKEHYERLLNVEFPWRPEDLSSEAPCEGPAISITTDMIKRAIKKMKFRKAAGPSGIVAEMLKASGALGVEMIRDLAISIVKGGQIPSDWEESFIINLYKGKGDALDRGNYRGLKLLDQVMKVIERVVDELIREQVKIHAMQFGFMPRRGATDAIFIVRQMQEKYYAANKRLYFAFVDLEKAFDRVPRDVIWWAMRKLKINEGLVRLVQSMYRNVRSRVRVGESYSEEFEVKVGVHQGSVLSPLLFVMVLEALSREFRTGCPWELLYADDLVIVAETRDELLEKLARWKTEMEAKGLRVNMKKTKILISGPGLNLLSDSGESPCAVCRKGVGANSIHCGKCSLWVHKKCSGIKGKLNPKASKGFECQRCLGNARPVDGRPEAEVMMGEERIDVVASFCYLGDMLSAGGGCELASITRIKTAWGKFNQLLPILTSRALSLPTRGCIYNTCVRSAMLHASETWALNSQSTSRLVRNDKHMIRRICNVKRDQRISSVDLLRKLGIPGLEERLQTNRLRWFGHVERARPKECPDADEKVQVEPWISRVRRIQVKSKKKGRPKKTWEETLKNDREKRGMLSDDPHDRDAWRIALRRKGPTPGVATATPHMGGLQADAYGSRLRPRVHKQD